MQFNQFSECRDRLKKLYVHCTLYTKIDLFCQKMPKLALYIPNFNKLLKIVEYFYVYRWNPNERDYAMKS